MTDNTLSEEMIRVKSHLSVNIRKKKETGRKVFYRKRGYRSRNRSKAGNWPRKAVTIESWERTIFFLCHTFRIRPPYIKYVVV